jgi:hypothetical protein
VSGVSGRWEQGERPHRGKCPVVVVIPQIRHLLGDPNHALDQKVPELGYQADFRIKAPFEKAVALCRLHHRQRRLQSEQRIELHAREHKFKQPFHPGTKRC